MIGYTVYLVRKNSSADSKKLGVQIGRLCIEKNISVKEIAVLAGVSTQAVYKWFIGEYSPRPALATKLLAHLDK